MKELNQFKLFDSHFHVIDSRFPLVVNQGYLPQSFSATDYLNRTSNYAIAGGAIVSGSFQAFDQTYLLSALAELGPAFVGVTQLPVTVADAELISLNRAGIRAVRYNLQRGGSEGVKRLDSFARRVHDVVGWHTELYVDAKNLSDLQSTLIELPVVCIDHLGLSSAGLPTLLSLVENGVFVKASGFGRVDFDVKSGMQKIVATNPDALVFGTDLPSTRAPQPYFDNDYFMVIETLGEGMAQKVFYNNAVNLYRPANIAAE